MTEKEAKYCVRRKVLTYIVTYKASGASFRFTELPTAKKLAKMFPEGYSVEIEEKVYALPIKTFIQYAEVVEINKHYKED